MTMMEEKPEVKEEEKKAPLPRIESAADLKGSKRLPDESFEDYKIRRKREAKWTKARLRHGARRVR